MIQSRVIHDHLICFIVNLIYVKVHPYPPCLHKPPVAPLRGWAAQVGNSI